MVKSQERPALPWGGWQLLDCLVTLHTAVHLLTERMTAVKHMPGIQWAASLESRVTKHFCQSSIWCNLPHWKGATPAKPSLPFRPTPCKKLCRMRKRTENLGNRTEMMQSLCITMWGKRFVSSYIEFYRKKEDCLGWKTSLEARRTEEKLSPHLPEATYSSC